jgi:lantibiotic modifying enzyme
MRNSMGRESSSRQTEAARLLVLGYRGTLRPLQIENLPPAMETLLEPWLAQASGLLNQRVPHQHRIFQGEPVPLDSLLPLLKDRLIGILTQAAGAIGIAPDDPSASDIDRDFPLLPPLIRSAVCEWVAAIATFLRRLHRDHSRLAVALQCGQLPPIDSISGAASDMHPGGHAVLRVCFRGGGCLYYKPRPLTGEWLWRELLDTTARLDPQLPLPAARVFTIDANRPYGWSGSVLPEEKLLFRESDETSPSSPTTAVDYWHAAGAMLCLAQHARLTDLHLANIIATPFGPAVTDAECFATPSRHQPLGKKSSHKQVLLADPLDEILDTGLLPRKHNSNLPDVSGLFGHAAPVSVVRLPAWSLSSDGRYRLNSIGGELIDHGNALTHTTPIAVLPQMLGGYRHAAELLIRARKTLLAPGSQWLAVLENLHAPRVVIRDTLTYGYLLSRSLEPRYLRSQYRRRNAILAELQSHPSHNLPLAVVRAELSVILQLHIPRFTILSGGRTLATGSGRALARRFTASTPAQCVFESIETLSSESIDNLHVPALLAATC